MDNYLVNDLIKTAVLFTDCIVFKMTANTNFTNLCIEYRYILPIYIVY